MFSEEEKKLVYGISEDHSHEKITFKIKRFFKLTIIYFKLLFWFLFLEKPRYLIPLRIIMFVPLIVINIWMYISGQKDRLVAIVRSDDHLNEK